MAGIPRAEGRSVPQNVGMTDTETGPRIRRAGILLHPTSLPSGTLGADAFRFVDFLERAGQTAWQVLPMGPPGYGGSPYASRSAFAGGMHLLPAGVDDGGTSGEWEVFVEGSRAWLDEWALFEALRSRYAGEAWWTWPRDLALREPGAVERVQEELAVEIERERRAQFRWWRAWQALRTYARERRVEIIGDLPIFVDLDSADAWANQQLFKLEANGSPRVVAGVPPDLFSETGQRWGNPLYDWDAMAEGEFGWWVERMRWSLRLFDSVRVDHFRGFAAAWEIPSTSPTAQVGEWVPGPGKRLFDAMAEALGPIPMIAEDLGIITPDVVALRRAVGAPGMTVLQFAFGGDATNPYLPHNTSADSVIYTGTHDNDTTGGWLSSIEPHVREHLRQYTGMEIDVRGLVRMAYASVARTAIVPFQDVIGAGGEARMNVPGTSEGNWDWRFRWEQVKDEQAEWLKGLAVLYGRPGFVPRGGV